MEVCSSALRDMIDQASEQLPLESCGLMMGRGTRIERVIPARNVRASRHEFAISPAELARSIRVQRPRGLQPLGIFHSHPASAAWPSRQDIDEFRWAGASYWIVSLQNRALPVVRCFRREGGTLVARPYTICESGPE